MALGTQPVGKLLDYEQYIEHQLKRTRSRIKFTDVFTAGLLLATLVVTVIFIEILTDHTLGLPLMVRRIVLWGGVIAGSIFTIRQMILPLVSQVNGIYAAKTIEEANPAFKNSLINYLSLRNRREDHSKAFMAAVEAKAVKDLAEVEVDTVVNQRRLLQVAYALSTVVVLFCVYFALTPKSIYDSARRILLADVVRPTNTQLTNIKPGDFPELSRVVAGSNVPFSVDIKGTRPEKVFLHHSVDGGNYYSKTEFAPGTNLFDPWQTTLRDVRQSLDYYLSGGDGESLRYHLEILPAPMVTSVSVDYEYPTYTGLAARSGVEGGSVEAVEGTLVTIHAKTNEPAISGYIDFNTGEPKDNPKMDVTSKDAFTLTGKIGVTQSRKYTIKFKTTGGQLNPDPVVYEITAIPDRAPPD